MLKSRRHPVPSRMQAPYGPAVSRDFPVHIEVEAAAIRDIWCIGFIFLQAHQTPFCSVNRSDALLRAKIQPIIEPE